MSLLGNVFPTVTTTSTAPAGGTQSYKFEINGVESDVHRASDQSQDVFQGARAFFGANAANNLHQDEYLTQEASGVNEKFVTYEPPSTTGNVGLDKLATSLFASRFLARGRTDNFQDQIGGQSAVSSGFNANGEMSQARNDLLQEEHVEQIIEESAVKTFFDLRQSGDLWNASGQRRIDAILDDQVAEANLFNHQRQGYTTSDQSQKGDTLYDNPSTQFAASDGTVSQNNLVQDASSVQKNNTSIENILDFRRTPSDTADGGSTEIAISLNGDFVDGQNPGKNRAASFVESIQEQALVQQAQAGFDELGNPTGNGGTSINNAIQTVSNVQIGQVYHLTDILV